MKSVLYTLIIISAFATLNPTYAKSIRIEGHEPDYAGLNIVFQAYTDPVSRNTQSIFSLSIGPQGRIIADIDLREPIYCFAEIDIYLLKLMLAPGDTLRIKLPPRKSKSFEESKNPYFKPIEIWVLTQSKNASHLNSQFARFDQKYYMLNDKYFNQLYYGRQISYLDSVMIPLENEFGDEHNPLFSAHKKLMLKSIESGILRTGRERLMSDIESLPLLAWMLPSFSELLDRLYSQTWVTESRRPQGRFLKSQVAGQKITELRNWTAQFTGTEAPLKDLILLKLMHDAFYSGEFSKRAIIEMLGNDIFTKNQINKIPLTAKDIQEKLEYLLPGTPAPEICLPLISEGTYCSKTSGKTMQYILFADLEIPVCQEQVKYLTTLNDKIGNSADILLILKPSDRINQTDFIKRHNIPGKIVLDTQDAIYGRLFKVRAYPSAFLIDQNHLVILAPAKNPLDGFEFQFESLKRR